MPKRLRILGLMSLMLLVRASAPRRISPPAKTMASWKHPSPTTAGDKVEVIEFFSYGCSHCSNLEPHVMEWATSPAATGVEFVRVPVA